MKNQCKAIVVDDEDWIREGLCEEIKWDKLGIELVASFSEGAQALEYALEQQVGIILSDIRMPEMTGLEMLARLRERTVDNPLLDAIKVIYLSGYGDFAHAQEALRLGAYDYLLKPAEAEDIELVLERTKLKWEQDIQRVGKLLKNKDSNPIRKEETDPSSYLVKKAQTIIRERYAEDLQLNLIAAEVFVSANYLTRLFRKETGSSYIEYLSSVRLEKAIDLLMNSQLKIYEIGERVGYPNPRYFSEWFQKQTGLTPMEYRNRHS